MTERELLMKKLASYDFSIDELQLYLNTHPNDKSIISKLRELEEKAKKLRIEYEEKFGPISESSIVNNPHAWINSPWPWDGGDN